MDWLTFISEVLKALAWPAVAAVVILLFHTPVGAALSAFSERVKYLHTMKAGNFEMTTAAVDTVKTAVVLKEEQASKITDRLVKENIDQNERAELVDELRMRDTELAKLRNTLETWSRFNDPVAGGMMHTMIIERRTREILDAIALDLGPREIASMADGDIARVREMVNRAIGKYKSEWPNKAGLNGGSLTNLRFSGLISEEDKVTDRGLDFLIQAAYVLVEPPK